ncbi:MULTISPECIES: hypothetical protein [unclassified Dysgonomonas]|uniref:hypothetical protein n=1 Tax=unclassified Dysgonomonas TaxID=2630389 RepID=UPI002475F027|nr:MULTISPECIES: hypothetical protein [unclassified Dysgonomonas]
MDAVINDTLQTRVFFDTGVYGLLIADSLNIFDESESAKWIKIGNNKNQYYDYPKGILDKVDYRNPVFSWFNVGGIIGWDFFEGKIIEISYKDKYIKEIQSEDITADYESIPMQKEEHKWGIPGIFSVQNNKIDEYVMIDTGNTSTLTFNHSIREKYNINLNEAEQGKTSTANVVENRSIIYADTISTGSNHYIENKRIAFLGIERRSPFAGILGNVYFENFTIVLDFKNGIFYIKK